MSATPLAVVTGASSGIGRELATLLARRGHDLVVTARGETLDPVVTALRSAGREVVGVHADLATPDGVAEVHRAITGTGRPVDVLALNAGRAGGGAFADTSLQDELELIDLNVRSTVHLAKLVVPAMARRGSGRVLLTSSIAATTPGPNHAVYNASKAFVQSFAVALRSELADTGVSVTALMPGPTRTGIWRRAGMLDTFMGSHPTDEPEAVARMGLDALFAGRERVIASSLLSKATGRLARFAPDRFKAEVHKRIT